MTPAEIKLRMVAIREQIVAFEAEVKIMQEQCPHPEFVRGLTMIACIQPIDICTTCGHGRPIDYDPLRGGHDYTSPAPQLD